MLYYFLLTDVPNYDLNKLLLTSDDDDDCKEEKDDFYLLSLPSLLEECISLPITTQYVIIYYCFCLLLTQIWHNQLCSN